ncbi:hypothetical protein [Paracoccus sp. (in: a-proteobacteria)]|uniref:hypothetical protein n=1 Tax=Paracoccus sp. TaxID=267 RepID=UPI00396CBDC9
MTRTAHRIARLGIAGSVALLVAMPALSASRPDQSVQGWSAMQGIDPATLLSQVQTMPLSEQAIDDQPYCASDAEIAQTLTQDFDEEPVNVAGAGGTELWGSDLMGTWTLVAARPDETSCIIASGIGYSDEKSAEAFYTVAGL